MSDTAPPSDLVRVRRRADRGRYDRATVHAVLDEALVCHLGFVVDDRPWVIPTLHVRVGEDLYVHGAVGNRALKALATGAHACATVSLVDGLVLARSAFHHSVNYRSVVVTAVAALVDDPEEKRRALDALVEHVVPGRAADARPPSESELRSTAVVRLPIDEASAKVRTGDPIDDDDDLGLPVWAGVVPLHTVRGAPVAAGDLDPALPLPEYLRS